MSRARKAELEVVVKKKIGKRLWISQKEDREETGEPAVSTHREAFASFSTCIQWVEGQLDCDIVCYSSASSSPAKGMQRTNAQQS